MSRTQITAPEFGAISSQGKHGTNDFVLNVYSLILSYACAAVDVNTRTMCEQVAIKGQERSQGLLETGATGWL